MSKPLDHEEIARPGRLILLNAATTGFTICAVLVLANVRFDEATGYLLIALAPAIVGLAPMILVVAAISDVLLLRHLVRYRKRLPAGENALGWIIALLSTANVAFYVYLALIWLR